MKKAPIVVEHDGAEKRELSAYTPPSKSTASGSDLQNTVPHGRKREIQKQLPESSTINTQRFN